MVTDPHTCRVIDAQQHDSSYMCPAAHPAQKLVIMVTDPYTKIRCTAARESLHVPSTPSTTECTRAQQHTQHDRMHTSPAAHPARQNAHVPSSTPSTTECTRAQQHTQHDRMHTCPATHPAQL
eukprot:1141233-Pelagomonas_calceolata.AAC.4